MSYSGEEKQTRRNGDGDTLNVTILRQHRAKPLDLDVSWLGKLFRSAKVDAERGPIERNAKFAAQLVTYSCAHMSRVSHWQARGS